MTPTPETLWTPDELRNAMRRLEKTGEVPDLDTAADAWEAQLASLPGGSPAGAWEIMRQLQSSESARQRAAKLLLAAQRDISGNACLKCGGTDWVCEADVADAYAALAPEKESTP